MSEYYPRVRFEIPSGYIRAREGLGLTFYLPPRHPEFSEDVLRAVELYLRYVNPKALGLYATEEGEWAELNEKGWNQIRCKLREWECPLAALKEANPIGSRYAFFYKGKDEEFLRRMNKPDAMCEATFWLPTEYLEEHGPGRVRELTIELATLLPVRSGFCGLTFLGDVGMTKIYRQLIPYWKRYPGFDVPDSLGHSWDIGKRITGPHWMNILGQPVLGELGGVSGLRERLKSPETTVQELPGDKAVITLGAWPEAGDVEKGEVLPAYRELARVLEPWLYHKERRIQYQSPEETLRWERRFLD
jgi:hypothetical protein